MVKALRLAALATLVVAATTTGAAAQDAPAQGKPVANLAVGYLAAAAEQAPTAVVGSEVRLWTSPATDPIVGKVVRFDDQTLILSIKGVDSARVVLRSTVTSLEVNRRRSRGKSVLVGALAGVVTAVTIAYTTTDSGYFLGPGASSVILSVLTVPAGSLLGLAVGPGADRWTPAVLGRATPPVAAPAPGVAARLSFRF